MELMQWILSAGVLGALGTIAGVVINRRNVKSEADARDLKTPAEVDNLVATTHGSQMKMALDLNASLAAENARLVGRLSGIDERLNVQGEKLDRTSEEVGVLQRGLASAYAYISTLLAIIREHLPNVSIPPYPDGYKPPRKE